jgi:hypothetical protein
MDRGIFLCQRGTAGGQGDLLAMGVEKCNAEIVKSIEQADGCKCIPV